MMNVPLYVLDLIFALWITMALRRTLKYLHTKKQTYKLRIMKTFAIVLAVGVFLILLNSCIRCFQFFVDLPSQWLYMAVEFSLVTAILSVSGVVFRPQ